jgi:tetratricopeptide (TPR) repeat protein
MIFTMWTLYAYAHEDTLSTENKQRVNTLQNTMRKELTLGNIEKIKSELEQAIGNFHAVEIELAMIQTLMQAGEYRHALSAAAHTQAEHPDIVDSILFYAYLLALGGQNIPATQLLESSMQAHPNIKAMSQLLTQIKQQQLNNQVLSLDLSDNDIQLSPFNESINKTLSHVGNGVIVGNGTQVITTLDTLKISNTNTDKFKPSIWVRNGLGQQTEAEVEQVSPQTNLALLRLKKRVNKNNIVAVIAQKNSPAGTPYYISGYRITSPQQADWPTIKIDVLGMPNSDLAYQTHLSHLVSGSPAYNTSGELIGVISQDPITSNSVVMPLTTLLNNLQKSASNVEATTQASNTPQNPLLSKKLLDVLYEETMSTSVQILIGK